MLLIASAGHILKITLGYFLYVLMRLVQLVMDAQRYSISEIMIVSIVLMHIT